MGHQGKTTGGIGPLSVADLSNPSPSWRDFLKGWKNFSSCRVFFALKAHHHQKTNAANPAKPRAVGYMVATWPRKQKSPLTSGLFAE